MFKVLVVLILIINSVIASGTSKPCKRKNAEFGFVCECTEDYCDTLDVPEPEIGNRYTLVTSSKSGERFSYETGAFTQSNKKYSASVQLKINRKKTYPFSRIVGFGGGFTGAVSYILDKLPPKLRECFYKSYFSFNDGMRYEILRIPIGSCDFDVDEWFYNETPRYDKHLSNMTALDPHDKKRNAQIKELKRIARNPKIKLLSAPWSSPTWMKSNDQLRKEYYQTFAEYLVKWLNLMSADNCSVWATSTANEPFFMRFTNITHLYWHPANQSHWIVNHFVPTIRKYCKSDVAVVAYDDIAPKMLSWLADMDSNEANIFNFIDAVGVHGYFDDRVSQHVLNSVNKRYNKPVLYTEMCFGLDTDPPMLYGSWRRAEVLTKLLMEKLLHDVTGYVDWNLILNHNGGPFLDRLKGLDAMIMVNSDYKGFVKQPMFYAMAHFSRFILPGSVRIHTTIDVLENEEFLHVAYLRPDRKIVVVLFNGDPHKTIHLTVVDDKKGEANITVEPRSLKTLIYSTLCLVVKKSCKTP